MSSGNLTASMCRQKHTINWVPMFGAIKADLRLNTKPWNRNVLDGYYSLQFISECSKRFSSYTKGFYCFCTIKWPLCFISTWDQCKDTTFAVDQFCTRFTNKDTCDFFYMIRDHALMIHYDRDMYLSWWIPVTRLHFKVKHPKTLTCCPHCVLSFHTDLAINSHYFLKQY
jgi:hypothetical protein